MTVETPTTSELSDNIVAQIEASLGQPTPLLPKAFIRVLAKTLAGVMILLFKFGGGLFLNMFVRTATLETITINGRTIRPLEEWGILVGAGRPAAATAAELRVSVTVTEQTGTLDSGTQLINPDTGVIYLTKETVSLDDDNVEVTIRAVSDEEGGGGRGSVGNLDPGDTVDFANPIANVGNTAEVLEQVVTGADGERTEDYRRRVIRRYQRRPQGGAYVDYEDWSLEVEGIVNAYPYTGDPGEVDIYVEADPDSTGDEDGIPTQAQLDAVKDSIEDEQDGRASRRPLGAFVNVLPIDRVPFDVEVTGLDVADDDEVKQDIEEAVEEFFLDREPFIPGLSVPPRRDQITVAQISAAVSTVVDEVEGTFGTVRLFNEGGGEIDAYALQEGEKAKARSIDFVGLD